MTPTLILATALLLGALHAFDADHLAAVTSFVMRHPSRRAAIGYAGRWALGHSFTLLSVGAASALFGWTITADLQTAAELSVGLTLVGIGCWVLIGLSRGRLLLQVHHHGDYKHAHLHRPDHGRSVHGHAIFWVGALHGLAGSAGLLVIIPVAIAASPVAMIAYVVVFSIGVMAAMATYAMVLGGLLGLAAPGSAARLYPWIQGAAGSLTLALGSWWISMTVTGGS